MHFWLTSKQYFYFSFYLFNFFFCFHAIHETNTRSISNSLQLKLSSSLGRLFQKFSGNSISLRAILGFEDDNELRSEVDQTCYLVKINKKIEVVPSLCNCIVRHFQSQVELKLEQDCCPQFQKQIVFIIIYLYSLTKNKQIFFSLMKHTAKMVIHTANLTSAFNNP